MSLANLMSAGLADRLNSPDGQMKMADLSGKLIFDRLREQCFSFPILAGRPIGIDECQLSENSDTLVKMEFVEPQSRAMSMNFRGDSETRIIRADRAFMSFYTIASEVFQKTEEEMQMYRSIPVSQILERNTLKDMEELRDHGFLTHAEAAVQYMQKEANGGTTTALNATSLQSGSPPVEFSVVKGVLARDVTPGNESSVALNIQRPDFVALKKMLSANRLEHSCVLISAPDLDGVDAWTLEDTGDRVQSDTHSAGFKGNMLLGIKVVKSIKSDILRPGNVYLFTAPQFLGRFYLLNKTKFYVDKRFNRISWQAWETLGMLLLNVSSVKKLELYSCDATSVDDDSLRSEVLPKAERDLGAKNNRVEEGGRFPVVSSLLGETPASVCGRLGVGNHALLLFGDRCSTRSTTSAPSRSPGMPAEVRWSVPGRFFWMASASCHTGTSPCRNPLSSVTGSVCWTTRRGGSSRSEPGTVCPSSSPRTGRSTPLPLQLAPVRPSPRSSPPTSGVSGGSPTCRRTGKASGRAREAGRRCPRWWT